MPTIASLLRRVLRLPTATMWNSSSQKVQLHIVSSLLYRRAAKTPRGKMAGPWNCSTRATPVSPSRQSTAIRKLLLHLCSSKAPKTARLDSPLPLRPVSLARIIWVAQVSVPQSYTLTTKSYMNRSTTLRTRWASSSAETLRKSFACRSPRASHTRSRFIRSHPLASQMKASSRVFQVSDWDSCMRKSTT